MNSTKKLLLLISKKKINAITFQLKLQDFVKTYNEHEHYDKLYYERLKKKNIRNKDTTWQGTKKNKTRCDGC